MQRRSFLKYSSIFGANIALLGAGVAPTRAAKGPYPPEAGDMTYEITKTPEEWRAILSDAEFAVLREEDTERAFTSPLNDEKRDGTFHCRGCDLPVYASETKFKSGTGWPSFYDNIDDAVRTKEDNTFFSTRTEVHCRRCGGHLGHIFEDGPEPTGLRHCLNGLALTFKPA
ncbi:peptide-methionine (R)-S-oxide reductase MsrB [Ahrensia marina]|uniref:peptide-methionine (R)-S-oxide reductase n=1 Tax=Ahrensia marina TaxID=1514904 RepID=A0A0N0E900_9HYPH|nr:peptide-methionine (R)-S-oxide reductase MsrB [Ahrensia marina]KPB02932.1 methionine sulfoxide reductase B [Ahrensia marina]